MKKAILIVLFIILGFHLSFSQAELSNDFSIEDKNVCVSIKSNKEVYRVGDTIRLKIVFENKTNTDWLIVFRAGDYHFSQLKISQNNEKLLPAGVCKFKIPPLGFLESDYHKLEAEEAIEFELILEIIKFPIHRSCFSEQFYKSGYGILCDNYGNLFRNTGELKIVLDYMIQLPDSKDVSMHSAYHGKNNVWNQNLSSNTISVNILE